ncbi:MAG: hypothetical protein AB1898_30875 [Acidobacteriota bacterium]
MNNDLLFVLLLRGTLLTPLMARNALKSNVTWSSYPFLPPTSASGCLAELAGGTRWHEGNAIGLDARRLQDIPDYQEVFALGAYPSRSQPSRRHFRAHLGSIFNYEGTIWFTGRNEGKKPAVVEETLADTITFVVAAPVRKGLEVLHDAARGRLAPVAKKGSLEVSYCAQPDIVELRPTAATGNEEALALMPVTELGSLPTRPLRPGETVVHNVPVRSRLLDGRMEWDIMPTTWHEHARFRPGVPIFAAVNRSQPIGVSQTVWNRVREVWL